MVEVNVLRLEFAVFDHEFRHISKLELSLRRRDSIELTIVCPREGTLGHDKMLAGQYLVHRDLEVREPAQYFPDVPFDILQSLHRPGCRRRETERLRNNVGKLRNRPFVLQIDVIGNELFVTAGTILGHVIRPLSDRYSG